MTVSSDYEICKSIKMTNEHGTVKIALKSLGLTLSNAPPRFIPDKQEMENCGSQSLQKSFVFVSDIGCEDSGSIVVLGKSSLDAIQTQSLASYEQIRLKSMAMDCTSIISTLTPPEVQEKLTEVLQENLRLKEALEQNNMSMKQHINILVSGQDKLCRVHEAHKQKFAEIKNLVTVLKTENNEYKTKLQEQNRESREQCTQTDEHENSSKTEAQKQKFAEIKNLLTVLKAENNEYKTKLQEQNKESREQCTQTDEHENSSKTEMVKLTEKCERQRQEIAHMHRIVTSLKQQLESLYQNSFNSIKLEDLRSVAQTLEDSCRQHFLDSFTRYTEKLQTLGNCYAAQASRYTIIQECLQRCSEILTEKHDANGAEESGQSLESMKSKELQNHRSRLIDEELKTICERQEMIKSQNEFQKIFTDYNSALLELENLRKEREGLNTLQIGASLHDERLFQAKASLKESERLLDDERRSVQQDRLDITKQREMIEHERIQLQIKELKLASLHDEAAANKDLNKLLREQLSEYETTWAEQMKLHDEMRSEKNQLLAHIQMLEEDRNLWKIRAQYMHGDPIN